MNMEEELVNVQVVYIMATLVVTVVITATTTIFTVCPLAPPRMLTSGISIAGFRIHSEPRADESL